MSAPRILHVIWSGGYGGIERVVRDLIEVQSSTGWDVSVLIARSRGPWADRLGALADVFIGGIRSGWDLSPATIQRITKLFSGFDLLHLHTLSPALEIAALRSGAKVIHTVHGGKGINAQLSAYTRLLNRMHGYYLRSPKVHIVANSAWTADRAMDLYAINGKTIDVVPNGTRISETTKDPARAKSTDRFNVGTASRLAKVKRIDRLLQAFELLSRSRKDAALHIAGSGTEEANLKQQVEGYDLTEEVTFLGYTEDIASFFRGLSVAVFPAENEPFGLVALEAMREGIPVLVFSDAGGMADVVREYDPRNVVDSVQDLETRLMELMNGGLEQADRRGIIAYAEQFSAERMEKAYADIYRRVLPTG